MAASRPRLQPRSRGGRTLNYSWEEYKLFYETTEKVIDRRIALNTWNYGICIAMLGAASLLGGWAVLKTELRLLSAGVIIFMMIMGFLLCRNWIGQIRDLKLLNNAKFQVLNDMAPAVHFPEDRKSFEPFRKEWDILERKDVVVKKAGLKVKVLRSSGSEFLLPWAFSFLFVLVIGATTTLCWVNRKELLESPFELPAKETLKAVPTCMGNC